MQKLEDLEKKYMETLKTTKQKANMLRFGSSYGSKNESTARKLNFDKKDIRVKLSTGNRSKSSAVRYVKQYNTEKNDNNSHRNQKSSIPKETTTEEKK